MVNEVYGGSHSISTKDALEAIIKMAKVIEEAATPQVKASVFARAALRDILKGTWTQDQGKLGEVMHVASEILKDEH